ncbi:MAG TPA: hypothetical protein ENF57_00175 [Candidatus Korarchaeota archaeon]|nr:hypothetical protein [Candidatus Korarchaeota archaeon]
MRPKIIRSKAGKTLEISLSVKEGKIEKVTITGDFIAVPKSAIDRLEESLRGVEPEKVEGVVKEVLEGVDLVGVTVQEIIEVIRELSSSR